MDRVRGGHMCIESVRALSDLVIWGILLIRVVCRTISFENYFREQKNLFLIINFYSYKKILLMEIFL